MVKLTTIRWTFSGNRRFCPLRKIFISWKVTCSTFVQLTIYIYLAILESHSGILYPIYQRTNRYHWNSHSQSTFIFINSISNLIVAIMQQLAVVYGVVQGAILQIHEGASFFYSVVRWGSISAIQFLTFNWIIFVQYNGNKKNKAPLWNRKANKSTAHLIVSGHHRPRSPATIRVPSVAGALLNLRVKETEGDKIGLSSFRPLKPLRNTIVWLCYFTQVFYVSATSFMATIN